jgi:spore maturation protein CgeB
MDRVALSILYLGSMGGTCLDRANALRRIGHRVDHLDLRQYLPRTAWVDRLTWTLGGNFFSPLIARRLATRLRSCFYDLCYVDVGEWVTPSVIALLRRHAPKIINYNIDDPLGQRDGAHSRVYRQSLRYYDLCVVMRPQNVEEATRLGAARVICLPRAADEISHAPRQLTARDREYWGSAVLFIGTWFPERGPFLLELAKKGVPLTIRGSHWTKSPEWSKLRAFWKGGALQGEDYAKAIQCAKVNLGLLSKGNRDLHTTRSLEIPALGSLLCAERTSEHVAMYTEGSEALFWSDAKECVEACKYALANDKARVSIAAAGRSRLIANGHYNENLMRRVVGAVGGFEQDLGGGSGS